MLMSHKRGEDASKTPKDQQRTPSLLFNKLNTRFHFILDAASTDANALCPLHYTKETNALVRPWVLRWPDTKKIGAVFCNPPYSLGQAKKFLDKGYQESLKGPIVAFLITCDVSPEYYDTCFLAAEWIALKGRVEFNHEDGTPIKGSAMFGSNVIVFDQQQKIRQNGETIVTRLDWKE
jgi:phage N-6-adenine-methyltransferase